MLRFHGSRAKKDFEYVGYNSRLDAIQAAALRIFLPHLDEWTRLRREAAARYAELGLGEIVELPHDEPGHVYHMYAVRSPERDRLAAALAEAGIGHASYYTTPLHLQPALRYLGYARATCPRPRRRRARTSACRSGAGIAREQQARGGRRAAARFEPRRGVIALPVTGIASGSSLADAVLIVVAWRLTFFLRFDQDVPRVLPRAPLVAGVARRGRDQPRRRSSSPASTAAGGATSRRATCGASPAASRSACLLTYLVLYAFPPEHASRLPRRVAALDFLLLLALVAGSRLLARTLLERPQAGLVAHGKEVLVVGRRQRGPAARSARSSATARSPTRRSASSTTTRRRRRLQDPRRPRARHDRRARADPAREPPGRGADRDAVRAGRGAARRSSSVTRAEGIPVKTLPGLHELIAGDLNLATQIRPVQVEDVLGREQVEVDLERVAAYVRDRTVLVTGAGGSIGSELCRQLARLGAARLVLVEQGESALLRDRARARRRARLPGGDPGARRLRRRARRCGRSSSATGRRSSSTPPPTSTCRCWRRTRSRR